MYEVVLHNLALQELEDAFIWYENRALDLGKNFLLQVDKRMKEIALHPNRYPTKRNNYRIVSVEVFPYLVIYEIFEKDKLVFISYIFHAKRNPNLLFKRKR